MYGNGFSAVACIWMVLLWYDCNYCLKGTYISVCKKKAYKSGKTIEKYGLVDFESAQFSIAFAHCCIMGAFRAK